NPRHVLLRAPPKDGVLEHQPHRLAHPHRDAEFFALLDGEIDVLHEDLDGGAEVERARQHGAGEKCVVAKLRPVPLLRICSMASSGMPALPDIVIASDVATRATAQSMLLVSFIICADPGLSPATTIVLPHSWNTGIRSASLAGFPETIMASVPALAPPTPPLIGTSITVTSAAAHFDATSRTKGTPTVQVLTSVFMAFPASKPSGPESARRKISSVGSETMTVSHVSASS